MPVPIVLSYSHYSFVSEKLEAVVYLGIANSRMKDFFDIWLLSKICDFDGPELTKSVDATFKRRNTKIPDEIPMAFSGEFLKDPDKQAQWRAFARKVNPGKYSPSFEECLELTAGFALPLLRSAGKEELLEMVWPKGGPWQPKRRR